MPKRGTIEPTQRPTDTGRSIDKILGLINGHIDRIVADAKDNQGVLEPRQSVALIDYGKFLLLVSKADEDAEDYSGLTEEEMKEAFKQELRALPREELTKLLGDAASLIEGA